MIRRLAPSFLDETSEEIKVNHYFENLTKSIPSEIVMAWVTLTGLIKTDDNIPQNTILWILLAIFIILTIAWTYKKNSGREKNSSILQIAISTGSFVIWVFALGEPFSSLSFYHPVYGSIALILYSLIVPLIPMNVNGCKRQNLR
ncbi:hypothetical protein C7H19_04020 [Aphanothece hegewaldii CCALA 016]|uniref:Uncharacterized protein n=1 Tax=Aphanothece hegewaldii CCALA 016 TaxID=2107694 RepID=A0A2T1M1V0_9CHRO|nr:hypothetical protein [Aphanothece hegewaldii]PSF38683.1 hypothetical protein C7H19_04020 [Aphanothece hegewaldii CCALA 016]